MAEGARLLSEYPGKLGSRVRIPLSPPKFAKQILARSRPPPKAERWGRQDAFFPLKAKQHIKQAIIPAAGLGTRMQFLAKGQPKEMFPIGGRPMISYTIREAALSELQELYIVINASKDSLRAYLESEDLQRAIRSEKRGHDISPPRLTFIDQTIPAGSGDAIYRTRELIGDNPFALMMPDFVFFGLTPPLSQMFPLFERFGCDVIGLLPLQGKEAEGFGNVGIIQGEEQEPGVVSVHSLSSKVSDPLILKKDEQILKAAPRWILGPHFFSYLAKTKREDEWDDTPALQMLCRGREVLGMILEGRGFDMGNPVGFQAAEAFVRGES
jgi:UTP--glucose-1-phosphate uridylyltransferase